MPPLTSSPPLLSRLYLSVLCNKIIKEDSALHCGRQRSPQTLETRIQPDERVCLPRGKRQPQCRPVHRGRPAHTQRMVQLPEVHPRTVRPTEHSPRAQNPDAKSRGTRDNAVRLRHVEPACHYDTLRRAHHRFLTRCIGWRKHNRADHPISYYLCGHACQDGK